MATAEQLARYGEEKKDPLALILAARMKQEVGETPVEREKENKGDKGEAKSAKRDTSVQGLLEKAKKLAQGRKDIVALADEVGKSSTRGAEGGPRVARTVVRSTAIDTFRPIVFRGGEPAEVGISGDGDSDLDLYVYDELGNLICRAESRSDYEICRWTPRWEGPFQIRVKNLGVANYYRMWTN
jgi:hypothetical protein